MSDRFEELVDHPALGDEERARLRRVHELLLDVGPPADVRDAPGPPAVGAGTRALRPRRRPLLALAAALALVAAAGGGYVLGRGGSEEAAPPTATTVAQTDYPPTRRASARPRGTGAAEGASASVELLPRASSGDYPVRLRVEGLPAGTYELWVVDDGELEQLCGTFRTVPGVTDTVLTVPYQMRSRDDWVVVRPGTTEPLLTTT
ncbi:MAG TPA: hypothetical protein VNT23_04450 [Gaiellaceae bacterium]|nr:hypothetical protein [Gaiellaceae bacterium]